jgi:GTP-binding protein HflX
LKKKLIDLPTHQTERGVIVSLSTSTTERAAMQDSLLELTLLAKTAHVAIVASFTQSLSSPHHGTYIGKGKVEEIKMFCVDNNITTVIFDDDLSPAQTRNLEKEIERKIIDRSGLILDIFASRAKSKEAMTQVRLAQLQYMLPRLTRMWTHLSKQYGGVGTKGPGETQIESDRRMIRTKITQLKIELANISTERQVQRQKRNDYFRVALVGYTNAGKSTLMQTLSGADVFIEDLLFATLDTTVRQIEITSNLKILLSDTVGFIRKLPHNLVASFRSTLAEVTEADLLLHVVDASHQNYAEHIAVVEKTLEELQTKLITSLLVFNKIDKLAEREILSEIKMKYPDAIFISAARGINIEALNAAIASHLQTDWREETLIISQENNRLLAQLHECAEIISTEYEGNDIIVKIRIQKKAAEQVEKLLKRKKTAEHNF